MLYKPNYCCNCGEKIERGKWSLLTSRRFCETCEVECQEYDIFLKIGAVVMIFVGVFGAGSYLMSRKTPADLKTGQITELISNTGKAESQKKNAPVNANSVIPAPTAANLPVQNSTPTAKSSPNTSPNAGAKTSETQAVGTEAVYYCGAATKKGTPCSRRVKGGGRCWQHQGQPALLPQEKLRVQ